MPKHARAAPHRTIVRTEVEDRRMSHKKKLPVPANTDYDQLMERWGSSIDPDLLLLALTHRSYANEAGGLPNNERLEFLGDAVLSVTTADRLFHDYPDVTESSLSQMRASTVSQTPLAQAARRIGLGDFIFLGRGEAASGGSDKDSILSDTFEALIGATYLTHGMEHTRAVVLANLEFLLSQAEVRGSHHDWKTLLVEYAKAHNLGEIRYEVEGSGPDHNRSFTATVFASNVEEPLAVASASSKKHSESAVAQQAMELLYSRLGD